MLQVVGIFVLLTVIGFVAGMIYADHQIKKAHSGIFVKPSSRKTKKPPRAWEKTEQQLDEAEDIRELLEKFADYEFNKCITGDTLLQSPNGYISLHEIQEAFFARGSHKLISYNTDTEQTFEDFCVDVIDAGIRDVVEVTFSGGSVVECTMNHKFMGHKMRMYPLHKIIDQKLSVVLLDAKGKRRKQRVSKVVKRGKRQVYSLTMASNCHNYVHADGLVSADSHAKMMKFIDGKDI